MNRVARSLCLGLLIPLLLTGCQAAGTGNVSTSDVSTNDVSTGDVPTRKFPEANSRQILVVLPQQQFGPVLAGSRRYTHGQQYGQIPIHIRSKIDQLSRDHNLLETDGWSIQSISAYCAVFALDDGQDLEQLLEVLGNDPLVILAQPMHYFRSLVAKVGKQQEDPYAGIQYGDDIRHLQRLHRFTQGDSVKIAVVDSPIDARHPDLAGQVKMNVNFAGGNGVSDQLHGTAVAGIISALANNGEGGLGLAPAAELHGYSACSHEDSHGTLCSSFNLARAVAAVIDDGIDILNLSLAGPEDPLLGLLLKEALQRQMIVIASENTGHPRENFPASFPGVIAVGRIPAAIATSGRFESWHGSWYQQDERLSTRAGGGYQFFYGNSVASAGVAGLAALIRSRYSPAITRQWLQAATSHDCKLRPRAEHDFDLFNALSAAIGCSAPDAARDRMLSRSGHAGPASGAMRE